MWKNSLWWLELKDITSTEKNTYLLFFYICSESVCSPFLIILPFIKVFIWFSLLGVLSGQAGKLCLWNVFSYILHSRKWTFFYSSYFYLHFFPQLALLKEDSLCCFSPCSPKTILGCHTVHGESAFMFWGDLGVSC